MVNMNLNKTLLQSICIIYFAYSCYLHVSRSCNDSTKITRDGLFLDDLQTINHMLETINHVLEKCEYENIYSKQN